MALPTSPEFTTALTHLADEISASLEVNPDKVRDALTSPLGEEKLEALYDAWLMCDDRDDFDDLEDDEGYTDDDEEWDDEDGDGEEDVE